MSVINGIFEVMRHRGFHKAADLYGTGQALESNRHWGIAGVFYHHACEGLIAAGQPCGRAADARERCWQKAEQRQL